MSRQKGVKRCCHCRQCKGKALQFNRVTLNRKVRHSYTAKLKTYQGQFNEKPITLITDYSLTLSIGGLYSD